MRWYAECGVSKRELESRFDLLFRTLVLLVLVTVRSGFEVVRGWGKCFGGGCDFDTDCAWEELLCRNSVQKYANGNPRAR